MRKHHNLLGLIAVIVFVGLTEIATAQPYVCGDADGNEIVNISDAVYLITYIFGGGPEPVPLLAGDADGNEIVNISDAVYMISYIFGGGPAPICCCGTVTDIDGNTYQTIWIGDQCWMRENLKVTHYRNGDPVPHVIGDGEWGGLSSGAYCEYHNDPANVETYGRLYNWYAVDEGRNLAPEGWHMPTDDEWKQLEMYLGMSQIEADATGWRGTDEGGKLKEAGTAHWTPPNEGATNESGFTALPSGYRNAVGYFSSKGSLAYFWCSTEQASNNAWGRGLSLGNSQITRSNDVKRNGFSVRCVRDGGTIVVDPSPDSINGEWQISGPGDYAVSGNGDDTLYALTAGDYTMTWGITSGWLRPAASVQTLATNDTITFSGEYIEAPDSTGTISDCDGNVYQTIKIGDQWWMMENLKATCYRNGDPIPHVTDGGAWSGVNSGAYCDYNNDQGNVDTYGRLYNWHCVDDSRKIAPAGWHVPSDAEWQTLVDHLGGGGVAGGKLKETGTTHWASPNEGATNESGFTALPGGCRFNYDGSFFNYMGSIAYFWTSANYEKGYAWYRYLHYTHSGVGRSHVNWLFGFSVRCVRD